MGQGRLYEVHCWVVHLGHKNYSQGGRVAGKLPREKGPGGVGRQQLNMSQCVSRHAGLSEIVWPSGPGKLLSLCSLH